jgi:hypothetical protein
MENPLLEVLTTSPNRVYDVTDNYLRNVAIGDFKAHILDLLEMQREKCAVYAVADYEEDNLGGKWLSVNKDSILNAKLF